LNKIINRKTFKVSFIFVVFLLFVVFIINLSKSKENIEKEITFKQNNNWIVCKKSKNNNIVNYYCFIYKFNISFIKEFAYYLENNSFLIKNCGFYNNTFVIKTNKANFIFNGT
jgi:hypothetical protein